MKKFPCQEIAAWLLLTLGQASFANQVPALPRVAFEPTEWVPASTERLEATRGGFDLGAGLNVSFGIVRTISINGELINRTEFDLPDLNRITPDQANLVRSAMADAVLIQKGEGNFVDTSARSGQTVGTVIQNSLNGQQIQTLTVINTGVNSLGFLKSINTQALLKDALFASTRNL